MSRCRSVNVVRPVGAPVSAATAAHPWLQAQLAASAAPPGCTGRHHQTRNACRLRTTRRVCRRPDAVSSGVVIDRRTLLVDLLEYGEKVISRRNSVVDTHTLQSLRCGLGCFFVDLESNPLPTKLLCSNQSRATTDAKVNNSAIFRNQLFDVVLGNFKMLLPWMYVFLPLTSHDIAHKGLRIN
jgi:hypothetical protein